MKRLFAILTVIAVCLPVRAQHFDPEHRHAIEISSGIPPLHGFMLGGGSRMRWNGIRETTHLRACLNLGYTYAISEKWDFNFVVDAVSQFYTQEKFRSIDLVNPDGSVAEGRDYDWKSDPVSVDHSSRWWVSFNFDFRWKWYRTDAVRLYTAFGLGYLPSQIPILPYIAPVGINFGANHFYGVAELNFSPAASIILLGAGYRF